jgi:uncharacterized protein (TIGR03435 family)
MVDVMRFSITLITAAGLYAQSAFDVASVKPTQNGRQADGSSRTSLGIPSPGRFHAINANLGQYIRWAYQVRDYQISGPSWLDSDSETYDIEAKAPPQTPTDQVRSMVQALLAERFKLQLHRETKALPVYHLVKSKDGPKLRAGNADGRQSTNSETGRITSHNITMEALATLLSRKIGRPVFDKTEIQGPFDLTLRYAEDVDTSGQRPSIYTAVQEQLGLKLEPTRGPVEVLVIDHAQRPSEN